MARMMFGLAGASLLRTSYHFDLGNHLRPGFARHAGHDHVEVTAVEGNQTIGTGFHIGIWDFGFISVAGGEDKLALAPA